MENIMKKQRKFLWTALLLFMVSIFAMGCVTVSAATKTGFVTIGGKTYYIKEDGTKQKGWLQLNGSQRLGKGFLWENHPLFHKRHWLYGHRICLRQ